MTASGSDGLYRPGGSRIHRLPAHAKVLAVLVFVIAVVSTPGQVVAAFVAYAGLLATVTAASGVAVRFLARGLVVETPFVVFAALLPFIARGQQVDVLGLSLSHDGLVDAGTLLAKATLGVWTSMLLASTTRPQELVAGLQRLRLPGLLVETLSFMVRYLDVVTDDLRRMRIARESRAFSARGPRHWKVLATSAGALFVRSYERGERVHLAMLSRGYAGRLVLSADRAATRRDWFTAALLPACGVAIAVAARVGAS
ncbi:MAG TPA: cobalt ECF transporter T component CbiQ [Nocardioidaceae bacterium]|nr:cobalt ECF transporter T component CbiQ [Nocardioidaceae bacterium]